MAERDEQRLLRPGSGTGGTGRSGGAGGGAGGVGGIGGIGSTGSTGSTGTRVRLDQPRVRRRSLFPEYDPDAFGRLSEKIARFLGTGRFIVWMTAAVIGWISWNVLMPPALRFDPYPFILLTLALSLQASYAAPLILLAQNRQDDRDRVNLEQDRKRHERSIADTEFLSREMASLRMGLGEVATRDWIRTELQDLVKELQYQNGHRPRGSGPGSGPRTGHESANGRREGDQDR